MKSDLHRRLARDVLVAASLLARVPVPVLPESAFEGAHRAVWAYPVVGAALAGVAAAVGLVTMWIGLGPVIAAGLVLASLMILTGAMHEDGLADAADGLWGGWTAERRLDIMKDSRIGTYGVLGLVIVTGLRWAAYGLLLPLGPGSVIAAAALSRATLPGLMAALPHARDSGLSRSVGRPNWTAALTGALVGVLIAFVAVGGVAVWCTLVAGATAVAVGRLAQARIGGQTGDILGAAQQLSEVAVLLTLTAAWT